jgi:hypothetical protein
MEIVMRMGSMLLHIAEGIAKNEETIGPFA